MNKYVFRSEQFEAIDTPTIRETNNKDYVNFGEDNLYPQLLVMLYNNSAMHRTAIEAKLEGTIGEGIKNVGDTIINSEQQTLNELYKLIAKDYILFGGYSLNIIWNRAGDQIAEVYHLPFNNVRSGKVDDDERVTEYYYSQDWSNIRKYKPTSYRSFSSTDNRDDNASQIFYHYDYAVGNYYYPLPDYVGAINDIDLDARISRFHRSNVSNGLSPSLMMTFRNGIPSQDEQDQIWRDINKTFGSQDNAGKFFLNFAEPGREPTLEPIESANDDYYILLEERITSRILTAHRISSPLLLGIRDAGGGLGSNKDEMLVAYGHFKGTVVKPIQKCLNDSLSKVLRLFGLNVTLEIEPSNIILTEETIERVEEATQMTKEQFWATSDNKYATFFLELLALRDQAHIYHWQTKSYALHEALGDFYEDFIGKADHLAELLMGVEGRPMIVNGFIELYDLSEEKMNDFVNEAYDLFTVKAQEVIDPKYKEIYHELETLVADIDKLRYLLTLK